MMRLLLKILIVISSLHITPIFGDVICPADDHIDLKNKENYINFLSPSVFQVVSVSTADNADKRTIGTATLVSNEGYFLTASHIFEIDQTLDALEKKEMYLMLRIAKGKNEYQEYKSTFVTKLSEKLDLSLIKISDWNKESWHRPVLLDVKSDPTRFEARMMGYSNDGTDPSVSEKANLKRIAADGYLRVDSLSVYNGYSGGMLVTSNGMGLATLSGNFVQKEDGTEITSYDINDEKNNSKNAVPLTKLISELSKIKFKKVEHYVDRFSETSTKISDDEISQLITNNRLAAIALADKSFEMDGAIEVEDRYALVTCLLPHETLIERIAASSNKKDNSQVKFNRKVVMHALNEARNSDDLEYSLRMYELAITAINHLELGEAYTNFTYLDFYKTSVKANKEGIFLPGVDSKPPSAIIGASLKKLSDKDLSSPSVSRALLFSAATLELNKKGRYYEGATTAAAALKAKAGGTISSTVQRDWIFMNNKAIDAAVNTDSRNMLIDDRRAIQVVNPLDSNEPTYIVDIDKIKIPSVIELRNSIQSLGTLH